jgi:hypothetical protein
MWIVKQMMTDPVFVAKVMATYHLVQEYVDFALQKGQSR